MNNSFGKRFSDLRKEKGMTQEQIADRLGVSPQAVSKWENDISCPDITLLLSIAELLDTTVDQLLGKTQVIETIILPKEERKDIQKMVLKVLIASKEGDKVKLNLPMGLLLACINAGMSMPEITGGQEILKSIDFKQIIEMVEQGVMGKLVEIESVDGDTIIILVE